jgi:hypothetical protein
MMPPPLLLVVLLLLPEGIIRGRAPLVDIRAVWRCCAAARLVLVPLLSEPVADIVPIPGGGEGGGLNVFSPAFPHL